MTSPEFADRVTCPGRWRAKADDLLASAKLIAEAATAVPGPPDFGHIFSYRLLIHFALENLLKGLEVKKHKQRFYEEAKSTGKLPKDLSTHSVWTLASQHTFVSESDRILIRKLERCGLWMGRYPTPQFPRQFEVFDLSSADGETILESLTRWDSEEFEACERLLQTIRDKF